ncbi:laccase domain protein [Roseibium aquae]|uniref:Purine nucleoside phosphorylase n=1 Tax=Roseibium aquae TaxID=1323746 RepID=A0A916T7X2_9HYPH|nr:peptidoglycan editing factor PgeF [Roseibium aquae]GGB35009.1 laccase domain protein [Roseibium aquae]
MIVSNILAHPGVNHAFFTREGGVSNGVYDSLNGGLGSDDDRTKVLENRRRIAENLQVAPDRLVTPHQIHSPDVIAVSRPFAENEDRRADALVTATPGLAIGVATADCGPVLFADAENRVVGAAHAGWKGATTGILENTLDAMEKLGAARKAITAVLGPTISQQSYEVGPEFHARLTDDGRENAIYFTPSEKADHHMFDLPRYILDRLTAAGVGKATDLALCTYRDDKRFFSYRRTVHRGEPDYGRLLSVIVLTEE